MFGLQTIDIVVIAVYSLAVIAIGIIAMLRIKSQEDYFLGGRRFGKLLHIFSTFGQATSTDTAVGTVTTTYRNGAGGVWSALLLLWATPFYWFTAPWYRRMRLMTFGDFFRERYGSRSMAMFYSIMASFLLVATIGIGFKAMSVTVIGITLKQESALTDAERVEYAQAVRFDALNAKSAHETLAPAEQNELDSLRNLKPRHEFSSINETWLVWFLVIVIFIYGTLGGLEAAVWVDVLQGTLILVLSVLLLPFGIAKLNAMSGGSGLHDAFHTLHQKLPGHFFEVFGSAVNSDFTWYFVIASSVMATLNVAVQANQFTSNAAARNEFAARVGSTVGNYLKRFCTVLWGVTGLFAFALYHGHINNPDLVWGHATRDLLGGVGFGLVGLMIASLFAALQSTASTHMISAASLFTRNVYEPLVPGRSERHYLMVGRLMSAAVIVGAALLCTAFSTILDMLKFLWEFNAVIAAAFWCGIKWRGATRTAAWTSITVSLVLFLVVPAVLPVINPGMRTDPDYLRKTQTRVVTTTYKASEEDAAAREAEIATWTGSGAKPAHIKAGDTMQHSITIAPRAICWSQDTEMRNGKLAGAGMFYPEMYVLDRVFDLRGNPYALNETIRYAYKISLPFFLLIVVSLLGRRSKRDAVTRDAAPSDEENTVARFFIRMRTPVRTERDEDERAVATSLAAPAATENTLLFPRTRLEFQKWNREDAFGAVANVLFAFAIVGLLMLIVSFGA